MTETLGQKLLKYTEEDFSYKETKDINEASKIDTGNCGIYMEATLIYFELKNVPFILKEHGRRKMATVYTMAYEVLQAVVKNPGAFINSFSPEGFLVVYPGKDETLEVAVRDALKISYAFSESFKRQFGIIPGFEFAMGLDHGHIMGTKTLSDNGSEHISWFGNCIHKAMRICKDCSRPFYVGISGSIYHSLGENMRTTQRRILGIKKSVDVWTKVTYQFDNVKKHLYQTNHKISPDEA